MSQKFFPPRFQQVDANGSPIIGSLGFFQTGTSTEITTYSNSALTTANANPVNADSNGRFGPIFFAPDDVTAGIKTVYYSGTNGSGSVIFTDDPYDVSPTLEYYPQTAEEITAGVTPTDFTYPPLNVMRYGAAEGQDCVAAIQTAIDVASVKGGKVYLPGQSWDYTLTATTTAGGVVHHMSVVADNVEICGDGRATRLVTSVSNACVFLIFGAGKPNGISDWQNYNARDSSVTTNYTLTGTYTKGGTSVTTATASEAGNFSEGDLVIIRTGQTKSGTDQPDGEVNQVVSADNGTGVVTLRRPLAKDYAQENFDSGSSGASSVGGAGTACVYGIANVEDRFIKNIKVHDLAIDSTSGRHALVGGQIDGFRVYNVYADIDDVGLASMGAWRDAWFYDNVLHTRNAGSQTWHLAVDSCCVDTWFMDNILSSEKTNYVHVLEGASRTRVVGNSIMNAPSASNEFSISVTARAYDTTIMYNHISNGGSNTAVRVGVDCPGGVVAYNYIYGGNFTDAISVSSDDWAVYHIPTTPGGVSTFQSTFGGPESLSTWVYFDDQNPSLGRLPAHCFVTKVTVLCSTPFDSDGTDEITVGYDGGVSTLAAAVDVSSTTVTTATQTLTYNDTARDIEAYYTPGGSEPTQGKALVLVEYYRTERRL